MPRFSILATPLVLFVAMPVASLFSQDSSGANGVRAAIRELFEGMYQGDSTRVRRVCHPQMRLMTVGADVTGQSQVTTTSLSAFLTSLATPRPEGPLDERIWSVRIQVDGLLASAWTPYTFYVGKNRSHCGYNSFQLVKGKEGWQILQVTDTRTRVGCREGQPVPFEVMQAHLGSLISRWHRAAATADEDTFFGLMTPDAIYIGTDTTERWERDSLRAWSVSAFERPVAWDFTATQRHITLSSDGNTAWWDEVLTTWMGPCRATGILVDTPEGWKIRHYQLSVTVPNDLIKPFIELTRPR